MPIEPGADPDEKAGIAMYVDGGWQMLRERVVAEFAKSGVSEEEVEFRHYVRMQYYGQLNDLEIYSPHQSLSEADQVEDLIDAFSDAYGKLYARSARSPELGYLITNVIVTLGLALALNGLTVQIWGGGSRPFHGPFSTRTIRSFFPAISPAWGPPSSLSPLKSTRSAPAATLERAIGSPVKPKRLKSSKAPEPMSSMTLRPCFLPSATSSSIETDSVKPVTR